MTSRYSIVVPTQEEGYNGYGRVWKHTSTPKIALTVEADDWDAVKAKAVAVLPVLNTGYRYDYWPESVEELPARLEPTPTILHRTYKGFRYTGVN